MLVAPSASPRVATLAGLGADVAESLHSLILLPVLLLMPRSLLLLLVVLWSLL